MLAAVTSAAAQSPSGAVARPAAQSLDNLRHSAEAAARAQLGPGLDGVTLTAVPLDARLALAQCRVRLATSVAAPGNAQSRMLVRVSCPDPSWTLNVPVQIRRTHHVLVLRRAVARGEWISAADVFTQQRELPGLASPFLSRPEQLVGRPARRPLPAGTALTADALATPLLIKRGQQVTLVAQSSGFEVRAPGRALADAGAQQRVRVQNLNSLKVIEGVADTAEVVRVQP